MAAQASSMTSGLSRRCGSSEDVMDSAGSSQHPSRVRLGQVPLRQQFATALKACFAEAALRPAESLLSAAAAAPRARRKGARFRGVTRHKRTQRFEAHIWEAKKQIYLGGFDSEVLAAKSHDIMALRCKGGEGEMLNFPLREYGTLSPLIERLSREDIITALRNYSKAQTAKKLGAGGGTQPTPGGTRGGGVHKPRAPRRPSAAAAAAGAGVAPRGHRKLSAIITERCAPSPEGAVPMEDAGPGSPMSPAHSLHRPKGKGAKLAPRGSPLAPSTPQSRLRLAPAPSSPHIPGASRLLTTRGQCSLAAPAAAVAGCHPAGSQAEQEERGCPSPDLASPCTSLSCEGSGHGGAAGGGWVSASDVSQAAPAGQWSAEQPGMDFDGVDLEGVLASLVEETSLTFSATEESLLLTSMPTDASHSLLEHLNGTMLYTTSAPQLDPAPPGPLPHLEPIPLAVPPTPLAGPLAAAGVKGAPPPADAPLLGVMQSPFALHFAAAFLGEQCAL